MNSEPARHPALQVSEAEVDAELRDAICRRYLDSVLKWRSPRGCLTMFPLYIALGGLPLLPSAHAVLGVNGALTLSLTIAFVLQSAVAAVVARRAGPLSVAYAACDWTGTASWCVMTALFIYLSGSARSAYWFQSLGFVMVSNTTLRHRAVHLAIAAASYVALVALFALDGKLADAVVAALFGMTAWFLQHLGGRSALDLERERARGTVLARRAGDLLVLRERRRIARDLHDGVAADLTALLWKLRGLESRPGDGALSEQVRACLGQLREVVWSIDRRALPLRDLVNSLEDRCRAVCPDGVEFSLALVLGDPDAVLSVSQQVALTRILQETVRNAVEHATPTTIRAELAAGRELELAVEDDGIGLPERLFERAERGGLANLKQRVAAFGGSVSLDSSSGSGTRLTFRLPPGGGTATAGKRADHRHTA